MTDITQGRLSGILDEGDFGSPCAELTDASLRVLESRYLLRDKAGKIIENPRQLFIRVARAVASVEGKWLRGNSAKNAAARAEIVEKTAKKFFDLMASLRFLPNSPTLMNAGRPKGQLSACFVLPIEDHLPGVFETLKNAAVIHKSGGGTGFSFGNLRPAGDMISSSGGKASGPLGFLRIFDVATHTVKQGGTRRGANMAILPVSHPDVEAFIDSKLQGGIENFNISVGVSDAFMEAVKADSKWKLTNPRDGAVIKTLRARALWKKISESAWASGDPGVVFLDRINRHNPTPILGPMESTNPCGEQPLLPYESCNLGSINVMAYFNDGGLDWDELERDIETAVRFLDDIIEINSYPLVAIEEITMMNRKIGLGIMGWADLLMELGIPYDSEQAVRFAENFMKHFSDTAVAASEKLAEERGAFPQFPSSKWAKEGKSPRRNATVTTVAPTGTISIIAGVSSGIEPVFSLAYERTALDGEKLVFIHPTLRNVLCKHGVKSRKSLLEILQTGSVSSVKEIPVGKRRVFRTAMEMKAEWHVRTQAAFQKFTENGVSKTINLPASASPAQVRKIYDDAYALGCKGITVFRDNSKSSQVLKTGVIEKKDRQRDLLRAIDWLLDDHSPEGSSARKKASLGLADLSRARLKERKKSR